MNGNIAIEGDSSIDQTKGANEIIREVIQTEPGWYMAEEHLEGDNYYSVLLWVLFRDVGHKGLDGQDHSCNGGSIFQRATGNLGRVDDAGQHHILILP